MRGRTRDSWPEIVLDAWLLGAEAWMVVGLRTARLLQGGPTARREARLMMTEKIDSSLELGAAVITGASGSHPKAIISHTIAHYRKGVRANRRRLSRCVGAQGGSARTAKA